MKKLNNDFLYFTALAIFMLGFTAGVLKEIIGETYEAGVHGVFDVFLAFIVVCILISLGTLIGYFYNKEKE